VHFYYITLAKSEKIGVNKKEPPFTEANFQLAARRLDFSYINEWSVLAENNERFNWRPVLDKIRTYFAKNS